MRLFLLACLCPSMDQAFELSDDSYTSPESLDGKWKLGIMR